MIIDNYFHIIREIKVFIIMMNEIVFMLLCLTELSQIRTFENNIAKLN